MKLAKRRHCSTSNSDSTDSACCGDPLCQQECSSVQPIATCNTRSAHDDTVQSPPHKRVYNFAPGPACLPVEVLEECQKHMLNWKGTGASVMEMSHRSEEIREMAREAEADLRALLRVPDSYRILFLQGGASLQFAAVPLNLVAAGDTIDYLVTGAWSKKAALEGRKFCNAHVALLTNHTSIPAESTWDLSPDSKFVHYCDNETIDGVEFQGVPDVGGRELVVDMSSNFLSKPLDVRKFALIYAGAHKNVGPAGATVVIVREDLLQTPRDTCPTMLEYKTLCEHNSMYNTPPCWAIYVCGLVFKKLLKEGGLAAVEARNRAKAALLYAAIDESRGFYHCLVERRVRSIMNITFTIPSSPELEAAFVREASAAGMKELRGHDSVGRLRASIYNAMPIEGCQALAAFMRAFQAKHSQAASQGAAADIDPKQ